MDNNFGWQKQQVDERIQCALKNAATCRLSHAGSARKSFSAVPYKAFFIPVVVVFFLVGMLLSSCITAQPPPVVEPISQAVAQSNPPSRLAMADRIRFHDQIWEQTHSSREVKVIQPVGSMAIAERIHFQDRVWEQAHPSREVKVIQPVGKHGDGRKDPLPGPGMGANAFQPRGQGGSTGCQDGYGRSDPVP
jgi:hypothetical protein